MEVNNNKCALEMYLANLVGVKLFDKEQVELQNYITSDFTTMINKLTKGKGNCGYKVINKLFVAFDIPYIIEKSSKRFNGKWYWLVKNN